MNTEATRPNLFDYATSELSQDAFICWLLAHINVCPDSKLASCAKDLVIMLYGLHNKKGTSFTTDQIISLPELENQYENIDVFFIIQLSDGRKICFIIEDKTNTSYHSGQLQKYKKHIEEEYKGNELICIYFKTGYLMPKDWYVNDYGYSTLDYKRWYMFLEKYTDIESEIFRDYFQYIKTKFYDKYTNGLVKLDDLIKSNQYNYNIFQDDFIQLEYMNQFYSSIEISKNIQKKGDCPILTGTSFGKPWTQLYVFEFQKDFNISAKKELPEESLFWRIDCKNEKYYIRLNQYSRVKGNDKLVERKKKRLGKLKELFDELYSKCELDFSMPSTRGENESEVAILFFNDGKNTPKRILEHLPAIHSEFMAKAKELYRSTLLEI